MATNKTTITRAEYLQLVGLRASAIRHVGQLKELVLAAVEITGEYEDRDGVRRPEKYGHASDLIWSDPDSRDGDVDGQLRKLGITVAGEGGPTP